MLIVIVIGMLSWFVSGCTTTGSNSGAGTGTAEETDNSTAKLQFEPEVFVRFNNADNSITLLSENGKYRVSLKSNLFPLETTKIHSWKLHVELPSGEPVENAKIRIHGGMPAHKHGFPTTPRVKKYLGNGDYEIEGVKFSMPGEWEMRINIKEEANLRRDRVVLKIDV